MVWLGLVEFVLVTFMSTPEEPAFIIQITDESVDAKYFQKYVTLKRVKVTSQIALAKTGKRGAMIRAAVLMRQHGIRAHARPLELTL